MIPGDPIPGQHTIGVHEEEAFVLDAAKQGRSLGNVHGVPPHVRENRRVQSFNDPRPLIQSGGCLAMFRTRTEHHLHPDANAQNRAPARESAFDDGCPVHRLDALHARRECPDTRNDEAVTFRGLGAIGTDVDHRASTLERTLGGADIAAAVIEDDDVW